MVRSAPEIKSEPRFAPSIDERTDNPEWARRSPSGVGRPAPDELSVRAGALLNAISVCQSIASSAVLAVSPPGATPVIPLASPPVLWVGILLPWLAGPIAAGWTLATKRD